RPPPRARRRSSPARRRPHTRHPAALCDQTIRTCPRRAPAWCRVGYKLRPMKPTTKKVAFALGAALFVGLAARHFTRGGDDAEIAARDPKQILGRVWFDHLPKN